MDWTIEIGGLIGGIATAISLIFLWSQIKSQNEQLKKQNLQFENQIRKDKVEIILKLYSDFFNNQNFQRLFEILDQDDFQKAKVEIDSIIANEQVNNVKEIHLSQYLNFFNSLALLTKDGVVEKSILLQMFKYQLEKPFSFVSVIKYMEDFGFNSIKSLLPDRIFTYGTLSDSEVRNTIKEINHCEKYIENGDLMTVSGYELEEVSADKVYFGLVNSDPDNFVSGRTLKIKDKANWHDLFSIFDRYEEVGLLYDRRILVFNEGNEYVWVYMKRL